MMQEWFVRFAKKSSAVVGSSWVFVGACAGTIGWLVLGPYTGYSDAWQLSINTISTIATTLIVVLIQNTQNRDIIEIKTMLREIVVDLPEVDTRRALRSQVEDTE